MLPSTSPRETLLLGTCLLSLCSPPFPLHALALIHLSRQGSALAHLHSLPLMIWYSGLTALFLYLSAKAAPAYLPTALTMALSPLFLFQQAQYAQVFPLKPAPLCTLFAGLGSTNKFAASLLSPPIFLSFCRRHPVLFSIYPFTSNSAADLAGTVFSLLLFYQIAMGSRALVSPGERRG